MADYISPKEFDQQLRMRRLAQTPPPELPPAQQQDLSFIYPGVAPAQPTARMQYEQFRQTEPKKEDYPVSRLRRALAIAGGIAGGIGTRSVGGGIDIGQQILRGPYYAKEAAFQQELKKRADIMKSEEEGRRLGATLTEEEARAHAEEARRTAESARAERERLTGLGTTPGTPQFAGRLQIAEAQGRRPLLGKLYTLHLKDGTDVRGAEQEISDGKIYHIGPDGTRYGQDAIDPQRGIEIEEPEKTSPLTREFRESHQGREPADEAEFLKYLQDKESAKATGAGTKPLRGAQVKELGARTGLEEARTEETRKRSEDLSPEEIAQALAFRDNPVTAPFYGTYVSKFNPVQRRTLMANAPPASLPTNTLQQRAAFANIAKGHAANLEKMIDDPEIRALLGAWQGRVEIIKSRIGNAEEVTGVQAKPGVALTTKEQEFLSYLTANLLWETSSGVGQRPARQTIELISRSAPRASEDFLRIKGAIAAQKLSAQTVIDNIAPTPRTAAPKTEDKVTNFREEK